MVDKRKHSSIFRGAAGRERAEEELAKQKARAEARKEQGNMPFRFRVAVGETTQFVVLDDEPEFFRHEHNLKNPQTGFWDTYTGCTAEWDNCPVCEATGKDAYYALYLSVLDFTVFKTKDGQKHEFSRKLLVVKPAQQKKFFRAYAKAEKEGRTLRGAIFEATRDGDKDSSIGNDIEFVEYMEEDDLASYVRTWKDRDGKKQTEDCSVPYDYDKMFEEPDSDKLRALVGGSPTVGSREYERKALGRRSRDDDDDGDGDEGSSRGARRGRSSGGYEKAERTERMRGSRRGRSGDDEDADAGDDAEDETPPRRGSRRAAEADTTPARGARRSRQEPEEVEDETPPRRGARRTRDADEDETPPARGSRRRAPEPDDGDEDETPPGAGRRLPMRGRR